MADKRWTLYVPVLIVLALSIPLAGITLSSDFQRVRELASQNDGTSGFFQGISDDKSTSISIIPDSGIDTTISGTKENVTLTNQSGGQQSIQQSTPKGALTKGLINALIMVGLSVVSAFGLFFLFKKRRKLTLKMIFALAIWLCASLSMFLYLYMFPPFLEDTIGLDLVRDTPFLLGILVVGFIVGTLIVLNMVFRALDPAKKNPALIAFSILLGPFLAIVLPISFVIFLLIGVSLWDLWAAKRGVIKEIVNESEKQKAAIQKPKTSPIPVAPTRRKKRFDPLKVQSGEDLTSYGLYEGKHYSLGIGDFIFFSLLSSTAFTWFMLKVPWMGYYLPFWGEVIAILFTIVVVGAIILGLKNTLSFLERDSIMPGLPLSVLWGLIAFLTSAFFLEVMNMIMIGKPVNPF